MGEFSESKRRIAQYRLCLERDTRTGIIPGRCRGEIDSCYRSILATLDCARVELEGAGTGAEPAGTLYARSVTACSALALELFRATYVDRDPRVLRDRAHRLRGEAGRLLEHLRVRIGQAA